MGSAVWGLLGPETLAGKRRTRTLRLGAAVREFNDLAVPGTGGVWFGKQLFLARLGVAVAEKARMSGFRGTNIEVANAIEALACWLALNENQWNGDPRVRGATKMRWKTDLAFRQVRKTSFYVTQTMRQATIQPLRAFELVESDGERFNSFSRSEIGDDFIDAVAGMYKPFNRSVCDHLVRWVNGDSVNLRTAELRKALSPTLIMSESGREFLRERFVRGMDADGNPRRRMNAQRWVEQRRLDPATAVRWDNKPDVLDDEHWRNLHSGALFFLARDAAIELLDEIETHIGSQSERSMPLDRPFSEIVSDECERLRTAAKGFLDENHDPVSGMQATVFCRECSVPSDVNVVEHLLAREGRVL